MLFYFFVFVSISVSVSAHENRLRYNWGVSKTILIVGSSREEGGGGIYGVQTEVCRVWGEGGLIYIFLVSNLCQMRALIDDQHQLKSILGLSGVEEGREGMGKGAVRSY